MMFPLLLALAPAGPSPLPAAEACPPMSAYDVSAVNASNLPLPEALGLLVDGTPWRVEVAGQANAIRVSYTNVAGSLDDVLGDVLGRAGKVSGAALAASRDPAHCTIRVAVRAPQPAPAPETAPVPAASGSDAAQVVASHPAIPVPPPAVLRAGELLSEGLSRIATERGWSMRWNIPQDYVVDVQIPLPNESDLIPLITWVIRAYQAQGALEGVVPRFARGNRVVSIEPMTVRDSAGNKE